jgi:hypothetical protein
LRATRLRFASELNSGSEGYRLTVSYRNLNKAIEGESEIARPRTNKHWDYSAFVQYALQVIAIIREREQAKGVRKRISESK